MDFAHHFKEFSETPDLRLGAALASPCRTCSPTYDRFAVQKRGIWMENFEEDYQRMMRAITEINEVELIILKLHLLIEMELDAFIKTMSFSPEALPSRLRFADKLSLTRAFTFGNASSQAWPVLRAFNELRNDQSHKLHSQTWQEKYEKLIKCAVDRNPDLKDKLSKLDEKNTIIYIAARMFGYLRAINFSAEKFKNILHERNVVAEVFKMV